VYLPIFLALTYPERVRQVLPQKPAREREPLIEPTPR